MGSRGGLSVEQGWLWEQVGLGLGERGRQDPEPPRDQPDGSSSLENLPVKSKRV